MTSNRLIIILPVLILALYFGRKYFFPSEEDQIRRRMDELTELLSKDKGDNILVIADKIKRSLEYFYPPFQVRLEGKNEKAYRDFSMEDKEKIREALVPFKLKYPMVKASLLNVNISLAKTRTAASSTGTLRLDYDTESEGRVYDLYENRLGWTKKDGTWYINDVSIDFE
ncbi:MAG: hypothetical protein KDD43_12395 [Bdellovibrionales bacterium]|nr:hypothetical protein [Bdellovibrionales bacterium]